MVIESYEEREVRAQLTEEQAVGLMKDLSSVVGEKHVVEELKAAAAKGYNEQLKALGKREIELVGVIRNRTKTEKRPIRFTFDTSAGKKYGHSPFTEGEIIFEEEMTAEDWKLVNTERQAKLFPKLLPAVEAKPEEGVITVAAQDVARCYDCREQKPQSDLARMRTTIEGEEILIFLCENCAEYRCINCGAKSESAVEVCDDCHEALEAAEE